MRAHEGPGLFLSETMKKLHLPYVKLPKEYTVLLKSNLSTVTSPAQVFDSLRPNQALYRVLEVAFKEFDDGRGVEKLVTGLGWPNFRERMASLYVYKAIYGDYPSKTNMDLVEDIRRLEGAFNDHGVHGYSRLFLLGFYIRLANIQTQTGTQNHFAEVTVPDHVKTLLRLSQGRSEKIDWLILVLMHLAESIGVEHLSRLISTGSKFDDLYTLMPPESRESMHRNLLAYGASVGEPDFFLYEKV